MISISVQFSNLNLTLAGVKRLHGLTHTFPTEGITALVGSNGAGKSLLLKILHNLIEPTGGKVRWSDELSKNRRALVRQKPAFLRRSVRENLLFALHAQGWVGTKARAKADETLEWLNLQNVATSQTTYLSPGQQARLAMARALAIEPGTLLLDEPTASLDPEATLAFEELILLTSNRGTKVILVSHSLGQIQRLATDVLMLDQGNSIFFGPTKTFFTNPSHPKVQAFLYAAGFIDQRSLKASPKQF